MKAALAGLLLLAPLFTCEGALAAVAPSRPAFQAPAAPRSAHRILVVDDNRDAAETLATVLELAGHEVRVAFDGPGALAAAEEFKPEAALLDIGLPVMDGYELAGRLRSNPALSGLRLVAITGYGQATDRQRSLAAGFSAHLVKPVDLEVVLSALGLASPVLA